MKRLFLIITSIILFVSCSKKEVNITQTVERGGLIYKLNSKEPFTGQVFEMYDNAKIKMEGEVKRGILIEASYYHEDGELFRVVEGNVVKRYHDLHPELNLDTGDGLKNYLKGKWDLKLFVFVRAIFGDDWVEFEEENVLIGWSFTDESLTAYYDGDYWAEWEAEYFDDFTFCCHGDGKDTVKINIVSRNFFQSEPDDSYERAIMKAYRTSKFIKDGLWTEYYDNGNKKVEGTFKEGWQNGLWIDWYENGKKKLEVTYKDDKKNGLQTSWYENGQKVSEATFKDGKPDGLFVVWYESGQIRSEATFKDGKPVGQWTLHNEDGSIKEVIEY